MHNIPVFMLDINKIFMLDINKRVSPNNCVCSIENTGLV